MATDAEQQTPTEQRVEMRREMEQARASREAKKLVRQLNTIMLIIAVVYPLLGVIWTAVLLLQKSIEVRLRGVWMITATTTGLLLWWVVWKLWAKDIMQALMPRIL